MSITRQTFESILREYNSKQLSSSSELKIRRAAIEAEIPELARIREEISGISARETVARIRGGSTFAEGESYKKKIDSLVARRTQLLARGGYSPDALDPVYECADCRDTGYIDDKMCHCLKKRIIEVLYDQSNIKDVLKRENFDNFSLKYYSDSVHNRDGKSPRDVALFALEIAHGFIDNFDTKPGNLYILGKTGTGKTFLSNCIAKELIDRGRFVIYLSSIRFFELMAEASFNKDSDALQITKHIKDCDLLVIDDLGTEMVNTFTVSVLFDCINERLIGGKHTVISSNLSPDALRDTYSERIFSRIVDKYKIIELFGDDIRMKKRLEA